MLKEFVLENNDTKLDDLGGSIGATLIFVEDKDKEEPDRDE